SVRTCFSAPWPRDFSDATSTTETSPLSLHDALPISYSQPPGASHGASARSAGSHSAAANGGSRNTMSNGSGVAAASQRSASSRTDRKSTRLNSSHVKISYAVFCLKKKKINIIENKHR